MSASDEQGKEVKGVASVDLVLTAQLVVAWAGAGGEESRLVTSQSGQRARLGGLTSTPGSPDLAVRGVRETGAVRRVGRITTKRGHH